MEYAVRYRIGVLHTVAWNESVFQVRCHPARKHHLQERYPIGIVGFYLRASIGLPAGNWLPLCNSYDRIFEQDGFDAI